MLDLADNETSARASIGFWLWSRVFLLDERGTRRTYPVQAQVDAECSNMCYIPSSKPKLAVNVRGV